MDGYKIIYKEPDGTTTATFFGEPVLNFCLPNVALRKESVDRNIPPTPTSQTSSRRSPQGERG